MSRLFLYIFPTDIITEAPHSTEVGDTAGSLAHQDELQ